MNTLQLGTVLFLFVSLFHEQSGSKDLMEIDQGLELEVFFQVQLSFVRDDDQTGEQLVLMTTAISRKPEDLEIRFQIVSTIETNFFHGCLGSSRLFIYVSISTKLFASAIDKNIFKTKGQKGLQVFFFFLFYQKL